MRQKPDGPFGRIGAGTLCPSRRGQIKEDEKHHEHATRSSLKDYLGYQAFPGITGSSITIRVQNFVLPLGFTLDGEFVILWLRVVSGFTL